MRQSSMALSALWERAVAGESPHKDRTVGDSMLRLLDSAQFSSLSIARHAPDHLYSSLPVYQMLTLPVYQVRTGFMTCINGPSAVYLLTATCNRGTLYFY